MAGSKWASWGELKTAEPDLAEFGASRLAGRVAYITTLRHDGTPRIHAVSPFFGEGHLYVYMEPTSAKNQDLKRDARYALHCSVEDSSGGAGEFSVSGRARPVDDEHERGAAFEAARAAGHTPEDRYLVYELLIDRALATTYPNGKPTHQRWTP